MNFECFDPNTRKEIEGRRVRVGVRLRVRVRRTDLKAALKTHAPQTLSRGPLTRPRARSVWSAPAERSGDGALDPVWQRLRSGLPNPKRRVPTPSRDSRRSPRRWRVGRLRLSRWKTHAASANLIQLENGFDGHNKAQRGRKSVFERNRSLCGIVP